MGDNRPRVIPVMSAKLARYLLKFGYRIIDIKPNKEDDKRSIFLFESKEEIVDKIKEYTKNSYENM